MPKPTVALSWFQNRIAFVCYRCFMFLYTLSWSIYTTYIYVPHFRNYYAFLSNWAEWSMVVHFGISAGVAIYGLVTRGKATASSDSEHCSCTRCFQDDLRWFHRLSWVVFSAVISVNILVTIMYWSFLSHIETKSSAANVHQHVMNTVLMVIDLFVTAIPIRLLHFIYAALYGVTYVVFTLILHGAKDTSKFYPRLLDWSSLPTTSIGLSVGMILVAIPIAHSVVFGLYHLRTFIAHKLNVEDTTEMKENVENRGTTNQAYEMT